MIMRSPVIIDLKEFIVKNSCFLICRIVGANTFSQNHEDFLIDCANAINGNNNANFLLFISGKSCEDHYDKNTVEFSTQQYL